MPRSLHNKHECVLLAFAATMPLTFLTLGLALQFGGRRASTEKGSGAENFSVVLSNVDLSE